MFYPDTMDTSNQVPLCGCDQASELDLYAGKPAFAAFHPLESLSGKSGQGAIQIESE